MFIDIAEGHDPVSGLCIRMKSRAWPDIRRARAAAIVRRRTRDWRGRGAVVVKKDRTH